MRADAMNEGAAAPRPRGQVLVIAAMGLIVLLSMLGLAIDGGRGYWERRQAQNAAEHSALAAAWEHCRTPHPDPPNRDPVGAATAAAGDNGFTHDGTTTWVTVNTPASGVFEVVIRSQLRSTFSAIMGFQTVTAAGRAVADCRSTSGEGYALFAGGTGCSKQIEFAGSTNTIHGAMHSNGNIHISGGTNTFDGEVTYGSSPLEQPGSGNTYDPPHEEGEDDLDYPVEFEFEDYRLLAQSDPDDDYHYSTNDITGSYINANGDGMYFSEKKVVLDSVSGTLNVTLVAKEEVIISASNVEVHPFMDNLLAFSGAEWTGADACSKEGVQVSGSNNEWFGFIFAPSARVKVEGSNDNTLTGTVIAWSIYLSGSTLNNTADPSFFAGPPVLRLVE
jgi:Flp pilus assembly protein TadG